MTIKMKTEIPATGKLDISGLEQCIGEGRQFLFAVRRLGT